MIINMKERGRNYILKKSKKINSWRVCLKRGIMPRKITMKIIVLFRKQRQVGNEQIHVSSLRREYCWVQTGYIQARSFLS